MGLFQQRPEEPTEWGGLPAEPWEPRAPAETLADAGPIDLPLFGEIPGREIIAVTLQPVDDLAPAAPSTDSDGDAD